LRVLWVEDHLDTNRVMVRLLRGMGYEVDSALTATEGMAKVRAGGVDLLISDLGLPDGSGLEVVRAYREASKGPAVALSGYGMEEDVRRSIEAGFDLHLIKPVRMEQLVEAMGRVGNSEC
jgi:CheY-like chemotaxis protein